MLLNHNYFGKSHHRLTTIVKFII